MEVSFDHYDVIYRLDVYTGQLTARRDGNSFVPTRVSARAARMALAELPIAFGYARAMQDAAPVTHPTGKVADRTATEEPQDEATRQASLFANEYACHVFRFQMQRRPESDDASPKMDLADAWATWRVHGRLDSLGEDDQLRHAHPVAYTFAQLRSGTDWPADALFVQVQPDVRPVTADDEPEEDNH